MPDAIPKLAGIAAPCLALLLTGCVSEQRLARNAPARPAVTQTMQRQIANAVDAGDGDYAVRALRRKLVADPDNLEIRLQLARHYEQAGYPELAIEHYRLAAARFPSDARVAMRLARSLRDFDRAAEAIQILESFCEKNAAPPADLLSLLGILSDDAGRFADAEKAYRQALQSAPERSDLRNNLGYNLLLQGRATEAAAEFRSALAVEPRSQLINDNLALALLAEWKSDDQPKEALLRWQAVNGPAAAHNNLATVLMEQKRYAEARKELEIALGYQKDYPAAQANLKLLASLDGKPAAVSKDAPTSLWKRVTLSVHRWAGNSKSQAGPATESAITKQ